MIVFLLENGLYQISSPDGEFSKILSKEEGQQILRDRGCPEEIINDSTPGCVMA